MGWIGMSAQKYDTLKELQSDYFDTIENEVPSRYSDSKQFKCLGEVSTLEEAKRLVDNCLSARNVDGVAYCKVVSKAIPKTTQEIWQRKLNEEQKLIKYCNENNCYDRKSSTIGCKKCGSSLATKYMAAKKLNHCPLCGDELRSDTVLKTIAGYKANIRKYEKQYNEALGKTRGNSIFYYGGGVFYVG